MISNMRLQSKIYWEIEEGFLSHRRFHNCTIPKRSKETGIYMFLRYSVWASLFWICEAPSKSSPLLTQVVYTYKYPKKVKIWIYLNKCSHGQPFPFTVGFTIRKISENKNKSRCRVPSVPFSSGPQWHIRQ